MKLVRNKEKSQLEEKMQMDWKNEIEKPMQYEKNANSVWNKENKAWHQKKNTKKTQISLKDKEFVGDWVTRSISDFLSSSPSRPPRR